MRSLFCATVFLWIAVSTAQAQYIEVTRSDSTDAQWGWALYQGDVEWVKELIAKGYKVNSPLPDCAHAMCSVAQSDGARYPIQTAVRGGGGEIVTFLAKAGANLKVKTSDGRSLAHLAFNRPKALAALLQLKADPTIPDKDGNTVAHLAVGNGSKLGEAQESILELLKGNGRLLKKKNNAGKTPVDQALANHNEQAVKILAPSRIGQIEKLKKAEANRLTKKQSAEEQTKAMERLKDKENNCGRDGFWLSQKLLEDGMEAGDEKLVRCALRRKPALATLSMDRRRLHVLDNYRNARIAEIILSEADVATLNATTEIGNAFTVLYNNFRENMSARWVKTLLRRKVDPDAPSRISGTARELACVYGDNEIAKVLPAKDTGKNWKPGATVWIHGNRAAKIVRSCKTGAVVMEGAKQDYFGNTDISEVSDSVRYAKGKKDASGEAHDLAGESRRDKSRDIPAGRLVRVTGKSYSESAQIPNGQAVCETSTVLKKMSNGYWRGTVHCGGSARYTYSTGVSVEEIKESAPEGPTWQQSRCLERCLEKCGRPALGKEPSYSNQVCTSGCYDTCK